MEDLVLESNATVLKKPKHHWRRGIVLTLFLLSEFALAGSAEGAQKWQWIAGGSVPNLIMALSILFRL